MSQNNFRVWFVGGEAVEGLCWTFLAQRNYRSDYEFFFQHPDLKASRANQEYR
jgi:hypothetical protein